MLYSKKEFIKQLKHQHSGSYKTNRRALFKKYPPGPCVFEKTFPVNPYMWEWETRIKKIPEFKELGCKSFYSPFALITMCVTFPSQEAALEFILTHDL
jgi:squalene cyclase